MRPLLIITLLATLSVLCVLIQSASVVSPTRAESVRAEVQARHTGAEELGLVGSAFIDGSAERPAKTGDVTRESNVRGAIFRAAIVDRNGNGIEGVRLVIREAQSPYAKVVVVVSSQTGMIEYEGVGGDYLLALDDEHYVLANAIERPRLRPDVLERVVVLASCILEGVVVNSAGKPMGGCLVAAYPEPPHGRLLHKAEKSAATPDVAQAGADGRFLMHVHPMYSYSVSLRSASGPGALVRGVHPCQPVRLVYLPSDTATLRGMVLASSGLRSLEPAIIEYARAQQNYMAGDKEGSVDAVGSYTIDGLCVGDEYYLRYVCAGRPPATLGPINIAGDEVWLDIVQEEFSSLEIEVVHDDVPCHQASVTAIQAVLDYELFPKSLIPKWRLGLSKGGCYSVEGLPPSEYGIDIVCPHGRFFQARKIQSGEHARFDCDPESDKASSASIDITVIGNDGRRITCVGVIGRRDGGDLGDRFVIEAPDDDGVYRVSGLDPGVYCISTEWPGTLPYSVAAAVAGEASVSVRVEW